ncbi:uncharacterized protein C5L36_0C02260 [Pichia kudriavzevii]|uniref:Uncharacterized protein n=1 Tax=Pichia kudriavzevii TaxID=4909 RepID=A0A099P645_PICKU|nr:uncharacterized protein C5L36_0C02260 [Pichia kudriavzevii]AWU76282.1 hypothetical protein C5L36_0C02260 [Pichia kudriavzevii]KGK40380.1 hypothetical protein JL09_g490 [Pichia kudriavzevii]ONH75591.1 hypothetical protein BOH78_1611 [Pichia kudriavzevii]
MAVTRSQANPRKFKSIKVNNSAFEINDASKQKKSVKTTKSSNIKAASKDDTNTSKSTPCKTSDNHRKNEKSDTKRKPNDVDNKDESKCGSEHKGKRIPAYKIEQLQRLQKLVDMSSVAKPKGPITSRDSLKSSKMTQNLKLKLNQDNKSRISNVTNYDPVRKKYLDGKLDHAELDKVRERYVKIRKFKDVKAPKLHQDKLLQRVLNEISEDNKRLKYWTSHNPQLDLETFLGDEYVLNESKLGYLGVDASQRESLLEQKSAGQGIGASLDGGETNVRYKRIDIKKEEESSDLKNLLNALDTMKDVEMVDENSVFDGLELEDFTVIKKYPFAKKV